MNISLLSKVLLFKTILTMVEKLNLSWNHFQTSTLSSIADLLSDEVFADVTILSEDGKQLKAHKVILSACSSFFRNILHDNPHPHPLLYLSNISWTNLSNILKFMYQGMVEVKEEELE